MGSSTNKGNISGLLFTFCWICLVIIVILLARLMLLSDSKVGTYNNPKVADTVIGGTIYDKNQRILAMDVPQYDLYVDPTCTDLDLVSQLLSLQLNLSPDYITRYITSNTDTLVLLQENLSETAVENIKQDIANNALENCVILKKSYKRTYPAQFHASQLISCIEKTYESTLFPIAQFDTNTTYGEDLVLTLDLDVQYLLDLAVQNVYELQSPDYVVAQIVDVTNKEVLAATYYPFVDLNTSTTANNKSYLIGDFYYEGTFLSEAKVIKTLQNHQNSQKLENSLDESLLYNSYSSIDETLSSTIAVFGNETQKYLVYLGSCAPKYYKDSTVLEDAIASIKDGLSSQNKL